MRIKKHIASMLISATALAMLLVPSVAYAGLDDIELDLIPDGVEDALCQGMDEKTGGVLSCGDEGDITSFTEFDGSFEAPSSEGYDEGLTRATSAREFILNVTNFFLSFLGLAAVAVIIYGGFLYVTAGGQEEQSAKGKKSVMYAIIGILIVLSSYAIVNTLISDAAGGGEDRGGSSIYGSEDEVTGDEVDVYNINQISKTIQDITGGYVDQYTIYSNAWSYVDYAQSFDAPDIQPLFDWWTNVDAVDEDKVELVREYAEIINDVAYGIMDLVDGYSDTYEAAQALQEYTDTLLYNAKINNYQSFNFGIPTAVASTIRYYEYGDFQEYDSDIYVLLGNIDEAIASDFNEKLDEYTETLEGLGAMFGMSTNQFPEIVGAFETASGMLEAGKATTEIGYIPGLLGGPYPYVITIFPSNSSLRDVVESMGTLYALVDNLEFVSASITASVKEGSAPLTVSFDGLSSYDPSDLTIENSQYYWDLDGDGAYDENGASVSYTYDEVGTYRVSLVVSSQDDNVAPGQSYLSITVNPPDSNIVITASSKTGKTATLADYANGISQNKVTFTESEGASGITISLEGTTDGNGDGTVYHTLDCGNGEEFESESIIEEICVYPSEGKYTLKVEVTDMKGNTDRYIGTIAIASPAANIFSNKYLGDLNTLFNFDGSASTTDVGTITNYIWSATGNGINMDLGDSEEVSYDFDAPGFYTISLTVTDSADEQNTETIEIMVESQPPVADIEYSSPDESQPGTFYFDAGDSYDPDPDDTISYLWTFEGEKGVDYEFIEGDETSKEPVVRFAKTGSYDVTLAVSDQYADEDLKQTTEITEKVTVYSVLDISLTLPDGVAYQLSDDGKITIDFEGSSQHGVAFEIEYGDGEDEAKEGSTSANFSHTYTETGTYYVYLTVYDEDDNENSYTKKVYIGDSDSTIAVISVEKNGAPVSNLDTTGNTETVFTFDAGESKNTNGTSRDLKYSWDFGDKTLSTEKKAKHTYEETGTFEVTLTVSDKDDPSISSEDTFEIVIQEEPPEINALTYTVQSNSMVTPVEIKAEVDAQDPDGSIANYYWYYYDTSNTTEKLGAQITKTNTATITISTRGSTGDDQEYGIVVEVTDKAGNMVSSQDALDEDPTIEVENGENEAPVVEFSVSDTIVMLGDSVTLSSSSYDPDGDSLMYVWDLEGNGFSDNEKTSQATLIYTPTEVGCFDVELKAVDEKDQSNTSDNSIRLCVESLAGEPEAAFTYTVVGFDVDFEDASEVDSANGAELYARYWDFDTLTDSDGNGDPADDMDSEAENPSNTYTSDGTYTVALIIYDTAGSSDSVEHSIYVADTDPPTAAFTEEADGLNVSFKNNSSTSAETIVITSYIWDFDTSVDSDGDGNASNDTDSVNDNSAYTYTEYGTYTVQLTVMDSMNKDDSVTKTIKLEEPVIDIEGYLTTNPAVSPSDNKIHISGDSGVIGISYATNLDSGTGITCWVDKNVYYDTNGNGIRDDDHDLEDTNCTSGSFPDVYYESSWGLVVIMLTVDDTVHGNTYEVTKEIIFDINTGGTNLFPVSSTQGLMLIMVAVSFALLGASIYTVKKIN